DAVPMFPCQHGPLWPCPEGAPYGQPETEPSHRKEKVVMAPQTAILNRPKQDLAQKLQKLREIFADEPEDGRVALEKIMGELEAAVRLQQQASSAGRTGLRQGKVSELTMITKFAPGGAKRLRALLDTLANNFQGADKVGTVHDMRFVFLDNDTKLLFATAY